MRRKEARLSAILKSYISGYHEYALDAPAHLSYVSESFCRMLGMSEEELLSSDSDLYLPAIHPADGSRYKAFLTDMARRETSRSIDYRIVARNGRIRRVVDHMASVRTEGGSMSAFSTLTDITGMLPKTEPDTFLFWELPSLGEAEILRTENRFLKGENEGMKTLMKDFSDGVVAFEIKDDRVKPLYVSDNAYAFFGYSKESWIKAAQDNPTVREFVSRTGIPYEKYEKLFKDGEADFEYLDVRTLERHVVRAVCSMSGNASGAMYVMLYNQKGKRKDAEKRSRVTIRTFGYFDVFVDGRPIMFRNEKTKELLALLVDRKGGYVNSEEAISFLWEEEPANAVVLARYRKVALRLKNLLEEYGIPDIIESVSGKRRIVMDRVECDLYQYLSGEKRYARLFKGSYLTNYSWAEVTLGELSSGQ